MIFLTQVNIIGFIMIKQQNLNIDTVKISSYNVYSVKIKIGG